MNETSALWIPVGPAPIDANGFGVAGGVSGRVWTIAVSTNFDHQGTAATYLGIDGGGVWRSVDFTKSVPTWIPLMDHFPASFPLNRQVGLANIGALAVDPNNPWIIFAGSGDPADRGPNAYGQGLLKSTDGGNTWRLLSLSASTFTPGFARIFVDPTDMLGNAIYAVGGFGPNSPLRGIFKSADGGVTWNNIQNGMPAAVAVSDLDYALNGNSLTLFAGVTDTTGRNGGVNGIWQSTDGGNFWSQMFIVPLTDVKGQPVQVNTIGLIKLAADRTPGTPHGVFAAISVGNTLANVFKLIGINWSPSGNGLTAMNTTSAQSIGIAPDGSIYLGGVNDSRQNGLFQSRNGAATWKSIDVGSNDLRPHTDQHAWAFFAGAVYCGNDGGAYRFVPLPNQTSGPGTWESLNTSSLQTILSQGLGTHPQYPNVILEGSQDNGVALRNSGAWKYVTGDDDARCRFDPHDSRFAYRTGVSNPGFFFRSNDGGVTWPDDKSIPPGAQDYAPFGFHPTDSGRIALGVDQIFETLNRGDQWKAISGTRVGKGVFVNALAYGRDNVLYASFGRRLFQTTNDGGDTSDGNWPEINAGNDWHGSIVSIVVDPHNPVRVYLATDGGAIWQSANEGAIWVEITNDFPKPPLGINALALRSDSAASEATLFVATSVGVYVSFRLQGILHWSRLGAGLPDVSVTDLQFNNTNKNLVAATYGRGLFGAYLHFITDVGPGCASLENTVFHFSKDLDGRICLNQASFGDAFSGWFEVQGDGRTDAPPAATSIRSSIFVFVKGLDGRVYLNQAEFGHAFSGWFEVQGGIRTDASPSATSIGNTVFVFVKGFNNRVYLNQADFGHAFGDWFEVQGNGLTDASPAAAALNDSVFVFVKGLDGRVYLNQAEFGHAFSGWFEVQGAGRTDAAPAAASLGNTLFVVVKGLDGHIYLNQAEFGHAFSGWFELQGGGMTDAAPTAVAVGNSLFVFVKGLDGRLYLNQAEFGHPFSGWFEVGGGLH